MLPPHPPLDERLLTSHRGAAMGALKPEVCGVWIHRNVFTLREWIAKNVSATSFRKKEMETYNNVALFLPSQATPEGKWRCYRKPFGLKIVVLKRGLKFEFDLTLKMCLAIIMFITRSQADHLWGRPHRIWHWVLKTSVNTFIFHFLGLAFFYSLIQLSPKLKSKLTWLSTELGFKPDFQVYQKPFQSCLSMESTFYQNNKVIL